MARLKQIPPLLFAIVGVLLAIALLPQTQFAAKNHLDLLTGGWSKTPYTIFTNGRDSDAILPERILQATYWNESTSDEQLAKLLGPVTEPLDAVTAAERPIGLIDPQPRLVPLRDYCRKHANEAVPWAHLVRRGSGFGPHIDDPTYPRDKRRTWSDKEIERKLSELIEEGCINGERDDPRNAFFPSMHACVLWSKGEKAGALRLLGLAAKQPIFNEYAMEESDTEIMALEARWGYRGATPKILLDAAILFPHFAKIKALARAVVRETTGREQFAARVQLAQIAKTMQDTNATLIGVLVAQSIFRIAVTGEGGRVVPKLEAGELLAKAQAFDIEADRLGLKEPSLRLAEMAPTSERIVRGVANFTKRSDDDFGVLTSWRAVFCAAALLSLILVLPVYAVARWASRRPDLPIFAGVSQQLAWMTFVFLPTGATNAGTQVLGSSLYALLLFFLIGVPLAAIPATRRVAVWLGWTGVVAASLSALQEHWALLPAAIYVILWMGTKGWLRPKRAWAAAAFYILAPTVIAWVFVLGMLSWKSPPFMLPFVAAFALVALCNAFAPREDTYSRAPVAGALVLTALYLVGIGWEVRDNAKATAVEARFRNGANLYRESLGLQIPLDTRTKH